MNGVSVSCLYAVFAFRGIRILFSNTIFLVEAIVEAKAYDFFLCCFNGRRAKKARSQMITFQLGATLVVVVVVVVNFISFSIHEQILQFEVH
ncbi:MAG: hypothetical protein ACFE95_00035 [Candidatus Hodarchaeota archaeon]